MPRPAEFRAILRDATSIGLGVAAYGLSFGALGTTTGLSVWQTVALSALMFTGASQFALVGVLGAGGSTGAAVAAAWLLGLRNLAYAVRMNELLNLKGWKRAIAAQVTIDESTAMALAHESERDKGAAGKWAFWLTGASVYVWWNLATILGALGANLAGDPKSLGLDAAISAGFLALLWPQLRNRNRWLLAAAAFTVGTLSIPVLSPGLPIILGGLCAVGLAFVLRDQMSARDAE